jgi:fumarate hydratase subunit beta
MLARGHKPLTPPLCDDDVLALRTGDRVDITGVLYTARDAAHARMIEALRRGEDLPFDPAGQVIYYVGPSPAPPGKSIGAAGPTTSYRMDTFAPALYAAGIKATIGKGARSQPVLDAIQHHRCLYLATVGGAGALLARCIKEVEVIAYPELGTEAVRRIHVEAFPAIVINDAYGGDLYNLVRSAADAGEGELP